MTCALDLEADYVAFVPQYGTGDMPDLTPFASPGDLQKELLVWLLRGASDLADAMDADLALLPVNQYETSFLTQLDAAAMLRAEAGDHPRIRLAASTYHGALAEDDLLRALSANIQAICVLYLTDSNGRLPGRGHLPFAAIGETLRSHNFPGWLVLAQSALHPPGSNAGDLGACLALLRQSIA